MYLTYRPISGGSMNPARTLGPAIASSSYKDIWVYLVGPVTEALLGALFYSVIRETNKTVSTISVSSPQLKLQSMNGIDNNKQAASKDTLGSVIWYATFLGFLGGP